MKCKWVLAGLFAVVSFNAFAVYVDFDHQANGVSPIVSVDTYGGYNPHSGLGPTFNGYASLGMSFSGGVILAGDLWDNPTNVLATSDFAYLADNSRLPGAIQINFSTPVNSVSMRVINGFQAGDFKIMADTGASSQISLGNFGAPSGAGILSLSGSNIRSVVVSSLQLANNRSFALDNVNTAPVPEPSALAPILSSVLAAAGFRRLKNAKRS